VPAGVRIVSYNVHSLRDDLTALASVVRDLAPDILIIQEAPRRLRWRTKCASLAHSFGMYTAAGGLPSLGNLILTSLRVQVHQTWCLRYPLTPGRHLRGAAFALCQVPGAAPFTVAGSHLSTNDTERPAQAMLLTPALDACPAPVILGIDLNDTPHSPAYNTLTTTLTDPASPDPLTPDPLSPDPLSPGRASRGARLGAGPHSPHPHVAEPSAQPTYPAAAPTRRIDFLLAHPSLTVTSYAPIATPLTAEASDHLPLQITLTLP
jgi:endonuclease/exonuclease/phosphatase family metal-dependent hydrolase